MTNSPLRATVRTQADLERLWRTLMEPLGFGGRTLWIMVIDNDEAVPGLVEITDLPTTPTIEDQQGLEHVLGIFDVGTAPATRVAFLLSRPGRDGVTARDRVWATMLIDAARSAGARCEPVHLATDRTLVPITLDDLGVRSA